SANGGEGGDANLMQSPSPFRADSGAARAQSSATNTGDTGPATSTADASPVAISGDSGKTGATGDAKVNVTDDNNTIKAKGAPLTFASSGNTGDSGHTGDARAASSAKSNANSGAQSKADAVSGDTG